LISSQYFRHMRNESRLFNDFYSQILDNFDEENFDFVACERKFDQMIEDEKAVMSAL
jgi:hypothetical protein